MNPAVEDTTQNTGVCIVGGGPAGMMLAFLLARRGIQVILLEAGKDFDRDFRGDALSPGVLEVVHQIGLMSELVKLSRSSLATINYIHQDQKWVMADFSHLKCQFPYLMVVPQPDFLEFMKKEASRYPGFQIIMGASVSELIKDQGNVQGIIFKKDGQTHEVRAQLTVGADGRASRVRKLANIKMRCTASALDFLCFRIPRLVSDPDQKNLNVYVGDGYYIAIWDRTDYWQLNVAIPKGSYPTLRAQGMGPLQDQIQSALPHFAERMGALTWSEIAYLNVEPALAPKWYRQGLLLIGDAAHIMSPAGGVGINTAIQDAVAAANVLIKPLQAGNVKIRDLAKIQRIRKWPVRITQMLQAQGQKRLIVNTQKGHPYKIPFYMGFNWLRNLATRITGIGLMPVRVESFVEPNPV